MFLRAFGQQIDDAAAAGGNPVERYASVHKTEHFDPIEVPILHRPLHNPAHGLPLAFAHPGGGDFDAVHLDVGQQ